MRLDSAHAKRLARKAEEPPTTKSILAKFKKTSAKLVNCMAKLGALKKTKKC